MCANAPPEAVNDKMKTGDVEVVAKGLKLLNTSKTPPIYIEDGTNEQEALRLKYRYLDLRRPSMQNMLKFRHRVIKCLRDYIDDQGFIEVETPILTKSTPEGARDYLVPYRQKPGLFYALPQSPQIYKQLLMLAGLDRYYQVARCFRDEDGPCRPPARIYPVRYGNELYRTRGIFRGLSKARISTCLKK